MSKQKFVTCEGMLTNVEVHDGVRSVMIPLVRIKEYRYDEVLRQTVSVHFREIFERKTYLYVGEDHEKTVFNCWISKRIE